MTDLGRVLIAAAERTPLALAVVDGERRFDYAAWLDTVARLAAGLGGLGLGRGARLAVIMQNRWQMAALHWACQLAGVVVVPLNWRSNADELDYFLEDSGAAALAFDDSALAAVVASVCAAQLRRFGVGDAPGGTVYFDDLLAAPAEATPRAGEDDFSLMLYTSGTTGRGKGVPRTHRAERVAALAHIAQNCYRAGERTLGVMPLYHTMGVRSLLAMAPVGGAFVCQHRFDAAGALRLIEAERLTALYLVPTLYYDLLESPGLTDADVSSVRKLGFAGAPMAEGLLRRVESAFRPELFVNHYGSSEIYTFTIDQNAAAKPGSAGKAGINQRIRVVEIGADDPDQTVAAGVEGEVIASLESEEAFAGYWQRPDADARALRRGWYFTGDVGYCDADGDLFVTGRVDDMIITGGENVLPAEIESVLSVHPAVAEAAVAGLADERWGQKVAAFVVRAGPVDGAALDAHCRASTLAGFKRPRAYVFVRAIPKSPVGKVLRRLLIAGAYDVDDDAGAEAGCGRGA
ncbi:MAG: AMP-binding protein [Rhodospirillales bacterium]|nr:AMP-binding protein [Rhodospirillales bacterium]